jgi:small subunit ribosomal protein S2
MNYLTMKNLLEAGVHFGHQTRRWNPKMKPYIFGARNGIYIIDLQQTVKFYREAHDFVYNLAAKNGTILFVGTKKQAQDAVAEEAVRCQMPYMNFRWLGGTLTNFITVQKSINKLKKIESMFNDGTIERFTKKEILMMSKQKERLNMSLGGIKNMEKLPDALFIIDSNEESITVKEANKLGITVVAVVDTNCDPEGVDYIIPGNDDAIRAIKLISSRIADAVIEGKAKYNESIQSLTDKKETAETFFQEAEEGIEPDTSGQIEEVSQNEIVEETVAEEENF